ncbi:MAG: hypothetical protein ACFCU8_18205 [Thermosynechococcaceae cyanobacterium]
MAIVEKEVLLKELELQETADVLQVIEEENVAGWVDAIAQQLGQGSMALLDLQRHLKLSWGRVWLGLLLGGFVLESECDGRRPVGDYRFYDGRILVRGNISSGCSVKQDSLTRVLSSKMVETLTLSDAS